MAGRAFFFRSIMRLLKALSAYCSPDSLCRTR